MRTRNLRSMRAATALIFAFTTFETNRVFALRNVKHKEKKIPEGKVRQFKKEDTSYGVDISFPTHYTEVSTNYAWLPHNIDPKNNPTPEEYQGMPIQPLGNRQAVYDAFMEGCNKYHEDEPDYCHDVHEERVVTSLRQAIAMRNFTDSGFKKVRAPAHTFNFLKKYWEDHKDKVEDDDEHVYTNFWDSKQKHLDIEDEEINKDVEKTKEDIVDGITDIVQEWMSMKLYTMGHRGIRMYEDGAIVAPHVDELPEVAAAIINIAQDVNEEWPLEIIGHDGIAYNVTMMPGDMIMYESHSTFHGRPFALKGSSYVNYRIHFEPTGLDLNDQPIKPDHDNAPIYVSGGSWIIGEDGSWYQVDDEYEGYELTTNSYGATEAHHAAHFGDLEKLHNMANSEDRDKLHEKDSNGWMPIHEAAREGHKDAVELLLKHGADINERTNIDGTGGSPLWWALKMHGEDHPVVIFLQTMGAVALEPEL